MPVHITVINQRKSCLEMESAHFLPFWWKGEIDGSVKGGGMRRFQFPIKAANQDFLARVWNCTKPFLDLKHLPAHQAKVKQAAKRRNGHIIFVWQLLCTTGGEGGGESWIIYLDLPQDVSPAPPHQHQGGVILGAMHRGSFKL